jgi:hypothetical protein
MPKARTTRPNHSTAQTTASTLSSHGHGGLSARDGGRFGVHNAATISSAIASAAITTQWSGGVNGGWWKTLVRAICVQVNQAKKQPIRNKLPVTIAPVRFSHGSLRRSEKTSSAASVDIRTTHTLS